MCMTQIRNRDFEATLPVYGAVFCNFNMDIKEDYCEHSGLGTFSVDRLEVFNIDSEKKDKSIVDKLLIILNEKAEGFLKNYY